MRNTKKQWKLAEKFCKHLAEVYDVKLVLRGHPNSPLSAACASVPENKIWIRKRVADTPEELVIAMFHELGHIECARKGKYVSYHKGRGVKLAKAVVYHGITAERYVDKMGEQMCKTWMPDIKWRKSYEGEENAMWFNVNYKAHFYLNLKSRGLLGKKR